MGQGWEGKESFVAAAICQSSHNVASVQGTILDLGLDWQCLAEPLYQKYLLPKAESEDRDGCNSLQGYTC